MELMIKKNELIEKINRLKEAKTHQETMKENQPKITRNGDSMEQEAVAKSYLKRQEACE